MHFNQITEHLFVGTHFTSDEWERLDNLGITANVNLRDEARDRFDGSAPQVSLWLPTRDWHGPNVETIEIGARFIASMIEAGHKVYVHCRFGAGRAPIVGAGYLVTTGMTGEEALRFMKKQRPGFKPNRGQVNNLLEFADKWMREQAS
jgi:protein-tyrosine phosphatase